MMRSMKTVSCVAVSWCLLPTTGALAGGPVYDLVGMSVNSYTMSSDWNSLSFSSDQNSFFNGLAISGMDGTGDSVNTVVDGFTQRLDAYANWNWFEPDSFENRLGFSLWSQASQDAGDTITGSFDVSFTDAQVFRRIELRHAVVTNLEIRGTDGSIVDLVSPENIGRVFASGDYVLDLTLTTEAADQYEFQDGLVFFERQQQGVVPGRGAGLTLLAGIGGIRRRRR